MGKEGRCVQSLSTPVPGLPASSAGRGTVSGGSAWPQAGSWHLRGRGAAGSPQPTSECLVPIFTERLLALSVAAAFAWLCASPPLAVCIPSLPLGPECPPLLSPGRASARCAVLCVRAGSARWQSCPAEAAWPA